MEPMDMLPPIGQLAGEIYGALGLLFYGPSNRLAFSPLSISGTEPMPLSLPFMLSLLMYSLVRYSPARDQSDISKRDTGPRLIISKCSAANQFIESSVSPTLQS